MSAQPINTIRTELFASKRKVILFNLGVLLTVTTVWFVMAINGGGANELILISAGPPFLFMVMNGRTFDRERMNRSDVYSYVLIFLLAIGFGISVDGSYKPIGAGAIAVAVFLCTACFTHKTWHFLINAPHLRVYDNGIDVNGIGFWEWDHVARFMTRDTNPLLHVLYEPNYVQLRLVVRDHDVSKKKGKTGAKKYIYDEAVPTLTVRFEFPGFCASKSLKQFRREVYRYVPQYEYKNPDIPHKRLSRIERKKAEEQALEMGILKPTPETRLSTSPVWYINLALLFATMILCIYALATSGEEIPESWIELSWPFVLFITILLSGCFYWACAKKTIEWRGQFQKVLSLLLMPFFVWFMVYGAITHGLGKIIVRYFS